MTAEQDRTGTIFPSRTLLLPPLHTVPLRPSMNTSFRNI